MKKHVKFTVVGDPVGKQRPRFVKGLKGHAYTPKSTVEYEYLVRRTYEKATDEYKFEDVALVAVIDAYYRIPTNTSQRKRAKMLDGTIKPTKKPDADNIAKAILDALNRVAYRDDNQIVNLIVEKHYSDEPRVEVFIEEF